MLSWVNPRLDPKGLDVGNQAVPEIVANAGFLLIVECSSLARVAGPVRLGRMPALMLIFMKHTGIWMRLYTTEAWPPVAVAIGITTAAACRRAGKRHGPLFVFVLLVTTTRCHTFKGVSSLKSHVSSRRSRRTGLRAFLLRTLHFRLTAEQTQFPAVPDGTRLQGRGTRGNHAKQSQFTRRDRVGRGLEAVDQGRLYKQTQFGGPSRREGVIADKQSQTWEAWGIWVKMVSASGAAWPESEMCETNPIPGGRGDPPFHYSIVPVFQSHTYCAKQTQFAPPAEEESSAGCRCHKCAPRARAITPGGQGISC
jgi:hypothetical protein